MTHRGVPGHRQANAMRLGRCRARTTAARRCFERPRGETRRQYSMAGWARST
ncbi:hypothetical protein [Nocardia sp. MH4]|uniref:hypothetical protein n=1 Tax=Nocardia sp. MH4 TaxID=1768677 RepID=UPI001C4FDFB3|nr:hypothetical protein [Nocardia sp. MH4]